MTRDDYLPWGIVHKIMVIKEMTSSSSEHAVLLLFMSTIATITAIIGNKSESDSRNI